MMKHQDFESECRRTITKPRSFPRRIYQTIILLSLYTLIVNGCALFISHYDAMSYKHLTALKAFHTKFIDDFTFAEDRQWNEEDFKRKCDAGELRFREALEYEKAKKTRDPLREKAINILYEEFKANCDLLEKRTNEGKFFFSKAFAEELKNNLEKNYGFAIEGEVSRMR